MMTIISIDLEKAKLRDSTSKVYFTYSDIIKLPEYPEGPLVELINGDLYLAPSPTAIHQRISMNMTFLLEQYIRVYHCGFLFTAPIDVYFSEEDVIVPDIVFITNDNKSIIQPVNIQGSPNLLIEITSQNKKRDYVVKRNLYAEYKVPEYWIIDAAEQQVVVHYLQNKAYTDHKTFSNQEIVISRLPELQTFRISVSDIFRGL